MTLRYRRIITLGLCIAAAAGLIRCKSFKGANVNVSPNPLEVHADSVKFVVSASVPPKSGLNKKSIYNGKLVIENGNNKHEMGTSTINGASFPDIKKVGASTSVTASKPFVESMDGGRLKAKNSFTKGKKTKELPELDLAPCCITTSMLYCDGSGDSKDGKGDGDGIAKNFIRSTYDYQSSSPLSLTAKFQFPQNIYDIQPTEYEKEEIKKIGEFINKRYKATKMEISGFASPEGKYRRNQFLSIARSREVQKWLIDQLKARGYVNYLDSSFFYITTTSEDWEGFKANLDQTEYNENVKRQIIQIISAGYDEDVKEKKIMALVGGARQVEFILAPLRRATIRIQGFTASHTDEEIRTMLQAALDGKVGSDSLKKFFKADEFLHGVTLFSKREDKIKLYLEFSKAFTDDHRGLNEAGLHQIADGKIDEGIKTLKQADERKPNNPAVLNNLGVAHLKLKMIDEAFEYFKRSDAIESTPQSAFNLGFVHLRKARYVEAIEMFTKAGNEIPCARYNNGLCKLLTNDVSGAVSDLQAYLRIDDGSGLGYYLLGVAGARQSDIDMISLNLKKAVQRNDQLGPKAAKDLEFRRYHSDAQFQAAIKP